MAQTKLYCIKLGRNGVITVSNKQTVETELIDVRKRNPNRKHIMAYAVG